MRATVMYGAGDVRVEDVPDPTVQQPTDAVVRVLRSCICGSDLWPYGSMPASNQGTRIGHEFLGVVEDVGSDVSGLRAGHLVVVSLTDDVLFGDVWARPELSPRDRSLVTVAGLIAGGNTEQLRGHLARAKQNGLSETELKEVIIHMAFYAGWPKAMSAITVAKEVLDE